jgi:hypothetical protein
MDRPGGTALVNRKVVGAGPASERLYVIPPMANRARISLIVMNTVGVLVFLALWFYASWLAPMGSCGRVTDLDRAGVIDVQKLSALHPGLATNVRYNLPEWIAAREREASKIAAVAGLVFCVTNLVVIRFVGRRQPAAG